MVVREASMNAARPGASPEVPHATQASVVPSGVAGSQAAARRQSRRSVIACRSAS
jgi:hypothetical protein